MIISFFQPKPDRKSPLELDGWLTWNEEMWGLKSERVMYTPPGKDLPSLEGVIYMDKRGRVQMPPRNPYLPFKFCTTGTDRPERMYRQYLEVMSMFADDLKRRGIRGSIALPPDFIDGRPFQWRGMQVGVRYTFVQSLPYDITVADSRVRKRIRKAEAQGYQVERSYDWRDIVGCLLATGEAKGFSHRTGVTEVVRCAELMGSSAFVGHLVRDSEGRPVSGGLRLVAPGGWAIGWSQGTLREHLQNGVHQLLYSLVWEDIYRHGAKMFDWAGANIPAVALAKSAWGCPLVPYLTISSNNMRSAVKGLVISARSVFRG